MSDSYECPKCGGVNRDLYEYGMEDGDCLEVECGHCDCSLLLSCSIEVSYEVVSLPDTAPGRGER